MKINLRIFIVICFLNMCFLHLFSQVQTLCIKGVVTYVDDMQNVLSGSISVGDSINGKIKYNLNITDSNTSPLIGDYYNTSSPSGMYVNINNRGFKTDSSNVNFLLETVNNYSKEDNIVFHSYNNLFYPTITPLIEKYISWQLDDTNQTALSNTNIPTFINLNSWQQPVALTITGYSMFLDTTISIRAIVTSVDTCEYITSVENLVSTKENIKVYPNPFDDNTTFTIQSINVNEKYSFELFDVLSKQVRSINEITTKQFQVSRDGLQNGIYFYKIYSSGSIIGVGKLVVK